MAIIPQQTLFDYQEIENLGDLQRLRLVLEYIPDQQLMEKLEKARKKGRNRYKIRAMWNSIIAGIVYQHETIESLRRELSRNGQLRAMCGFSNIVPPPWVYSRFIKKIIKYQDDLVTQINQILPDYGKTIAIDGKGIASFANHQKDKQQADGRRDVDADFGQKIYRGTKEDGSSWKKVKSWFGYKVHLMVDAQYELPLGYEVTKASVAEAPMAHQMLAKLKAKEPQIIERCEILLADKGYDDGKLIEKAWDEYEIKKHVERRRRNKSVKWL